MAKSNAAPPAGQKNLFSFFTKKKPAAASSAASAAIASPSNAAPNDTTSKSRTIDNNKNNNNSNNQTQSAHNSIGLLSNHTDVIVYLAQFSKYHSSYGFQQNATGLSKLNKSLDLLYTNYVNHFPFCDVIVFYDSDHGPDAETIADLSRDRPQLKFHELNGTWWELPYGLKAIQRFVWNRPAFSVGYRHMIRWFAVLMWRYLTMEGYTHVMRMDDDSYLHSRVKYNLFEYMRENNKRYAFRQPVVEDGVGTGYDELIDGFLEEYPDATSPKLIDLYKQDRRVSFYNNWFMADISFFMSPPASVLLNTIDMSKLIYTQRTGDLVIHSTVARLFLRPKEIHWFRDFTYEHMTLCRKEKCGPFVLNGCPQNGGISRGSGVYTDEEWSEFAKTVKSRFKENQCPGSLIMGYDYIGAEDIRYCSKIHSRCRFYLELLMTANTTAVHHDSSVYNKR
mmetsp:Transcript_14450/g.31114  ORF Transcript_14450/g.31114 Transcript_14450/m.31114 type:complete len:450 (+) Transcript_14450:260-1609(+)